MSMIPKADYIRMVDALPILCVDIVLQNSKGEYLLVYRNNEPLKDSWWVIGGRVLKCENMLSAAQRKIKEETGLEINAIEPLGFYEDVFDKNPFNLNMKTHTFSIVFKSTVSDNLDVTLDSQSKDWKFSPKLPDRLKIIPFANHVE